MPASEGHTVKNRKCSVPECDRSHSAKGYCNMHYQRVIKHGRTSIPNPRSSKRQDKPFWEYVDKGEGGGCWMWTGRITALGYGVYRRSSYDTDLAHRISYMELRSPLSKGVILDHICHTRSCINPDHLRQADHAMNSQNRSGASKASTTGYRGVFQREGSSTYRAQVVVGGKKIIKSGFQSAEDADRYARGVRRETMPNSIKDREPTGSFSMPRKGKEHGKRNRD